MSTEDEKRIAKIAAELERTGRLALLRGFMQHGRCSVYQHSLNVAATAMRMARRFPKRLDRDAMIRGALLHDYFLYDWHRPDPSRPRHAFFHPRVAWENASRDYRLGPTEEDVIRRHMFPVVPIPPRTAEGWIVCVADTWCALRETIWGRSRTHNDG